MDGEVRRTERHDMDMKVNPEDWENIKKKYLEREEQKLEAALKRHKVASAEELIKVAQNAIVKRSERGEEVYKPLKDRTLKVKSENEEIEKIEEEAKKDIDTIRQLILTKLPKEVPSLEKKIIGLKGRVTKSEPESPK